MQKQSNRVRYCVTPTCLNEAKRGGKCWKCAKREWREKNPILASFGNLRSNAKRRGKRFKLDFEFFAKFVVDTSYIMRKGIGREDLTIDRRDPRKGYEPNNIQVLPNHINSAKGKKESWLPIKQTAEQAGTPF